MSAQRSLAVNLLSGTRGALGVIALITPRIGARMFRIDGDGSAIVMGRLFGVRNIALAAGLLRPEVAAAELGWEPRPFDEAVASTIHDRTRSSNLESKITT